MRASPYFSHLKGAAWGGGLSWQITVWGGCAQALQSEAGESRQSLSYVVYTLTIHRDGCADLHVEWQTYGRSVVISARLPVKFRVGSRIAVNAIISGKMVLVVLFLVVIAGQETCCTAMDHCPIPAQSQQSRDIPSYPA